MLGAIKVKMESWLYDEQDKGRAGLDTPTYPTLYRKRAALCFLEKAHVVEERRVACEGHVVVLHFFHAVFIAIPDVTASGFPTSVLQKQSRLTWLCVKLPGCYTAKF